jgi:outer membrane protein OmpA-like peptidoglycan-associated protein
MSRLRSVAPILLLPSLATPAFGDFNISYCAANSSSPRCEAERTREFAAARNAEINASMAAVNAARAWLALARTHCKTSGSTAPRCEAERSYELALARTHCKSADSTTPRCEAERVREFAAARNAEINASIAAVNSERARVLALTRTHCKSADSTAPRCEAERTREFAAARNAEIRASIAAVDAERGRAFAAARNAEIRASIAAVDAERRRTLAAAESNELGDWLASLNAQYEQVAFAAARNAEIDTSIARVEAVREFEGARNAETNASVAAVKAERARTFAAARNAEINASIAAVEAQRALRLAMNARYPIVETGAISLPDTFNISKPQRTVRHARQLGPCRDATGLMSPLEFSQGNAQIEESMKPELDRIAMMAKSCPAVSIDIHGHSDNSGPVQINRHLAQRRAQAALEYLVKSGVSRNRLSAIGHAGSQPLVPNTDEDNRAINRRVELTIHDPAMMAAAQRVMWDLAEVLDPTYVPPLARLSP